MNFLAIQEIKVVQLDLWVVRQVWGNSNFDFATSSARGFSGGLLRVWNNSFFIKSMVVSFDNYIIVEGVWQPTKSPLMFISVYAPQSLEDKRRIWISLMLCVVKWGGPCVMVGDFNEVTDASERFGSIFNQSCATYFNKFISDAELEEVSFGGFAFTWTDKWATKMSKLD